MSSDCAVEVVVVGSCNSDLTTFAERLPRPGETITGTGFESAFGGKGSNQAVCAARLGARVAMVAKVGGDKHGDEQVENLASNGVDTSQVTRAARGVPTGVAQVCVDTATGQNTIVIVPGANGVVAPADVAAADALFAGAKVTVCQLEIPQDATLAALRRGREHGHVTIFNPAPAPAALLPGILEASDIVCPNETELELLCGDGGADCSTLEGVERAARAMLERGAGSVVATLGERGALLVPGRFGGKSGSSGDGSDDSAQRAVRHFPAPAGAKAVDTTGAGDAFVGALAAQLARGRSLSAAAAAAVRVASVSVGARGAQASYPRAAGLPAELRLAQRSGGN
ncbi:Ribokinase-like protein [Tribonema minus]|uniref:Ribokinase n=1 Tax=Tribonema minus TaxID=303371 RepID=A0A835YZQ8_9STRA|nr:Ribokinase-like protein [Tribonema minus]